MKQAERRKFHYIYKITRNDGSGKYYIGMHSTDDLDDGYFGSGQLLWKSIKKHGKEKHSKEILQFLPNRKELKSRERELVNEEIVNDPLCMNLQLGGGGGFSSEEQRSAFFKAASDKEARIRAVKTIRQKIEEDKFYAETFAANRKKSCALAHSAVKNRDQVLERACCAAARHLSKEKRKATLAALKHMQGEKNSQFGTCWVINGLKPIKIMKEELDEYLMNGYRRGRE